MSVLIKGMKMPERCEKCRCCKPFPDHIRKNGIYCTLTLTPVLGNGNARLCNCPLIELPPHGRLIDADAIPYIFGSTHATEYDTVTKFVINKLPTIIGAED